ncbi:hypothetical protein PMNALOAF_0157 [Methylobacterium adhaesivum]|jgi:hypothetical protein|uniref:Uncharacterized protein n=1 Tax=Methylobacterium adhaesivum TaxID=333297 RepID=A0ABT8BCT5_9HYPH|nr:hypothetical protein [Methylobacterium adhaesivum]MDN3589864.1 hypothetical protein [Methylobacterium adhaesivum]GJD28925.1 hypothetical protein PMNALOAF_0157 [Methylobacterium adhaesivum]
MNAMRHGSCSVCSAALIGALWMAAPAMAQSGPGWVDPPAKSEPKGAAKAETAPESKGQPESAIESPAARTDTPRRSARRAERRASAAARREARSMVRQRPSVEAEPRSLARVPATPVTPMASADRFPEWAAAATRLTDNYLDSVSAPGLGIVTGAPRFYGETVRFHGRTLSLAAVMAEKRRFADRWPVRHYEPQGGATHTACNAATATCVVRTTFDYRAENPARGTRAQGVSELVLTVDLSGSRPVIVSETSRVLRRYGPGPLGAIAGRTRGA